MHTDTQRLARLLDDDDTLATTLLVLAVGTFGVQQVTEWDPTTLRQAMNATFPGSLSNENFNKLMAAVTILTTDTFFVDQRAFVTLCNALYSGQDPTTPDLADAAEIAWGIAEALLLTPPEGDEPFSQEILAYISQAMRNEGIMNPPDVLRLGTLVDPSTWQLVASEYTDDPTMFSAIYDIEQTKTSEIDQLVRERFSLLAQQLEALPLPEGDTRDIVQRLKRLVTKTNAQNTE